MDPQLPKTQLNTLFNYFSQTPKRVTESTKENQDGEGESQSQPSTSKVLSPGSPPKVLNEEKNGNSSSVPKSSSINTPKSSTKKQQKRRKPDTPSVSPEETSSLQKQARAENQSSVDLECSELVEGTIVWAKAEGYPWWPAMVKKETEGGPFHRNNLTEFYVHFLEYPPSRAWIPKSYLKNYNGKKDVEPENSDPDWIKGCEYANSALLISPEERVRKYWVDLNDKKSSDEESKAPPKRSTKTRPTTINHTSKARKRLKMIKSNDEEKAESETEQDCDDDDNNPSKVASEPSEGEVEELSILDQDDDKISPPKKRKKNENKSKAGTTSNRSINSAAKKRLAPLANNATPSTSKSSESANQVTTTLNRTEQWPHLKFQFLQPNKIQDSYRRSPTSPYYNPRTLFIPKDFLDKQTPALRQWWMFKSQNFDTILFFKVGKFYELFHMDAVIAVEELKISFMKGDVAHAGFPEISYSKWASGLVEKGYKVARIEQTESVDKMQERLKRTKGTKFDKVVNREICEISTRGVRYASFQDVSNSNPFSPDSKFLYGIVEKISSNGPSEFGVCFVDSTIGDFHIGQFEDDRHFSRLRTLFSLHTPVQILYEKGKISSSTQQLLYNYSDVRKDSLQPESEFWGAQKLLNYLSEQIFSYSGGGKLSLPGNLNIIVSPELKPREGFELGLKGLGGVVWYLKHCLLDNDLLSLKKYSIYVPVDSSASFAKSTLDIQQIFCPKYMVLDGITLKNLDILEGSKNLLSIVDRCATHFGKRLLRNWICMPLAIPGEISNRLDAVEELILLRKKNEKIVSMLKTLPDLERLLNKIHYLGSAHRSKNHPDGRANFFEEVKYSTNKISDLLSVLRSFKTCIKVIDLLKETELESPVLKKLVSDFPSMDKLLEHFDNAFNHELAAKEGKITPKPGVDNDFESAKEAVRNVQEEAEAYLKEISKQLQTRVVYFGSDKKRFQLEMPENTKVPKEFEMTSSRKGYKRYCNSKTKELLATTMQSEALREEVLRDITRRIFEHFDKYRELWKKAVDCISQLDVLMSLAAFSSSNEDMCRPCVTYSKTPYIKIINGRHPMTSIDTYIPNSCELGAQIVDEGAPSPETFLLLTGPNMGGKSTLMRQVGLLTILSHVGCYVPAQKCEMSAVDRIFTRLGANDNIGEGESTFFVEMSETSSILKHSKQSSLILIDELGRGTATYDGTAIAYAVAIALATKGCRTIFSTHYHTLMDSIEHLPLVKLGHMACMVENENDDPTQETITFLYKMIPGECPKSYGFNAARLAGIPDDVIRVAHRKAKEFEEDVKKVDLFKTIYSCFKFGEKKFTINNARMMGVL